MTTLTTAEFIAVLVCGVCFGFAVGFSMGYTRGGKS